MVLFRVLNRWFCLVIHWFCLVNQWFCLVNQWFCFVVRWFCLIDQWFRVVSQWFCLIDLWISTRPPSPPASKTMETITVLCISYDWEANHTPPRPFPKPWKYCDSNTFPGLDRSSKPFVFRKCVVQGVVQWVVRGLCGRFCCHGRIWIKFEWNH